MSRRNEAMFGPGQEALDDPDTTPSESEAPYLPGVERAPDCPSFASFFRARYDDDFKDVVSRATHFHCRCPTCHEFESRLLTDWAQRSSRDALKEQIKAHRAEAVAWRKLEQSLQAQARYNDMDMVLLSYDDTVALGLPRLTNRSPKGVPISRLLLTPMGLTDHGEGKNFYIYSLRNRHPKGANRL